MAGLLWKGRGMETMATTSPCILLKSSFFSTHIANGCGIISENAKDHTGIGMVLLNFEQLDFIVKGHEIDTNLTSKTDVGHRLGGIGKDDAAWFHTKLHDLLDLSTTGAIEIGTERHESLENLGLIAALHGVEGLGAGEHTQPLLVLAIDTA